MSKKPVHPKHFTISLVITVFLSFLGFLDATYLTILHYKQVIPPCSLVHGCETVLTSQFATIGSIPLALIGVFYFIVMLFCSILLLQKPTKLLISFVFFWAVSGVFVAGLLVATQAFILHAFCQYCLTAEGIILVIFLVVLKYLRIPKSFNEVGELLD